MADENEQDRGMVKGTTLYPKPVHCQEQVPYRIVGSPSLCLRNRMQKAQGTTLVYTLVSDAALEPQLQASETQMVAWRQRGIVCKRILRKSLH